VSVIRRRVLIIEDQLDTALSMALLIRSMGHDAEWVTNGADAFRIARLLRPDVVLCDIGLPHIDGYAIARQLRREPHTEHARIVAVSGYSQDHFAKRARDAGFDAHYVKPLEMPQLERILGEEELPKITEVRSSGSGN